MVIAFDDRLVTGGAALVAFVDGFHARSIQGQARFIRAAKIGDQSVVGHRSTPIDRFTANIRFHQIGDEAFVMRLVMQLVKLLPCRPHRATTRLLRVHGAGVRQENRENGR